MKTLRNSNRALRVYVAPDSDSVQIQPESVVLGSREQIGDLGDRPDWDDED